MFLFPFFLIRPSLAVYPFNYFKTLTLTLRSSRLTSKILVFFMKRCSTKRRWSPAGFSLLNTKCINKYHWCMLCEILEVYFALFHWLVEENVHCSIINDGCASRNATYERCVALNRTGTRREQGDCALRGGQSAIFLFYRQRYCFIDAL